LADVAKHSKSSDCWLAVDGTVYDATSFVTKHPGGAEILKGCGKDATALFKGEREHKAEATEMLKTLEIGKLGE
jgi:cytochrome b involved in lipid metabolism